MNKITIGIALIGVMLLSALTLSYSSREKELTQGAKSSLPGVSQSGYVVDESDMLNEQALIGGIEKTKLTVQESDGLLRMREEEKLAHDVYTTLGAKWGVRIFSNIASSEQTHADAMKVLLERYAIPDPVMNDSVGVFRSPVMQQLYNDLVAKGNTSVTEALIVGATVEDLDIRDLDVLMKETTKEDILVTYRNLQKGSRNHLRAFVKNLTMNGVVYTPQYITQEAYDLIINSSQERGRI